MSILKKLKKQPKPADLATISRTLANVKKLIDLKVITVNLQDPEFSLYPELWVGKDQKFKTNFCKNILIWRTVTLGHSYKEDRLEGLNNTLKILNIETAEQMGTYNKETGFLSS